ncbi:putative F-box protein At4g22660 [Phalaenopsis equestris]|uniref:putative F-box protein At4g22660 n=1 Tax=Phalaenopsis equestris TaxID=78828 RepID=UPI0009E3E6E6|nr:putative F-box protein At4g22660 [Phalaenopsis equestris]
MAWSDLPVDLLGSISSHLPIVDFLRFSAVCTSWNSALAINSLIRIQCRPSPWLLLPNNAGEPSDTLTFRDLTIKDSRSSHHRFSSLSENISGRCCIGSKDGWLVTVDIKDLQPRLFNPITRAEISLPSLLTIPGTNEHLIKPEYAPDDSIDSCINGSNSYVTAYQKLLDVYFRKIVLSSNNSSGTAVVIYRHKKSLALARPGDRAWVLGPLLPTYRGEYYNDEFDDIYYNEEEQMFYVITHFSAMLAFDHNGQNAKLICPLMQEPYFDDSYHRNYIVCLFGTLIKIEMSYFYFRDVNNNICPPKSININVFKFESTGVASSCSNFQWIPIKDLKDCSLFVGGNQTFSIHHTIAPEIRPNCIYFSDHWEDFDHDAGVFDLPNDCFEYLLNSYSTTNLPSSTWFTPSFS